MSNPLTDGLREAEDKYAWDRRRLMMYIVLFFCMSTIGYVLQTKLDTKVADTVVTMAFFTIIGIVGSYVFGATWQSVTQIKNNLTRTTGGDDGQAPRLGGGLRGRTPD